MSGLATIAQVPEVDPFSGIDFPVSWLIAAVLLGLVTLYLIVLRRNAYDDRAEWNYTIAAVLTGLLSLGAFVITLNTIFSSLPDLAGGGLGIVIVIALIAYGNARSYPRRPR